MLGPKRQVMEKQRVLYRFSFSVLFPSSFVFFFRAFHTETRRFVIKLIITIINKKMSQKTQFAIIAFQTRQLRSETPFWHFWRSLKKISVHGVQSHLKFFETQFAIMLSRWCNQTLRYFFRTLKKIKKNTNQTRDHFCTCISLVRAGENFKRVLSF